eukprot:1352015-Amorphochlora_amoeboformis.AAC.1
MASTSEMTPLIHPRIDMTTPLADLASSSHYKDFLQNAWFSFGIWQVAYPLFCQIFPGRDLRREWAAGISITPSSCETHILGIFPAAKTASGLEHAEE